MYKKIIHLPLFIVNFKSYVWGKKAFELTKIIEKTIQETNTFQCIIPQIVDISLLAKETKVPIIAPYMDSLSPGRGTGHILPESIKDAGAIGVLINHAEKGLLLTEISDTLRRAREVGLISIVSSSTPEEAQAIATLDPDIILIEPPTKIGTPTSVGKDREFVLQSIKNVRNINSNIIVICGAGVSSGKDVAELIKLGVDGTGASRAICEAQDPQDLLNEMVEALEHAWKHRSESLAF